MSYSLDAQILLKRGHKYASDVVRRCGTCITSQEYLVIRDEVKGKCNGMPWWWWEFVVMGGLSK